jgi:hypothetical protein
MAIKHKYAASSTTVISHAATLAAGANTWATGTTMTSLDNSTDKYPHCRFVLDIPDTFAAAPTAGSAVNLYMTVNNIDGTSDETPLPGATDIVNLARYVGAFRMDNQDVATRKVLIVFDVLAGVESADFYIENQSGQTISYSSNATTVKATPFTFEDV